jgi:predicted  nucleic acid-binding Zn-ribbon protein
LKEAIEVLQAIANNTSGWAQKTWVDAIEALEKYEDLEDTVKSQRETIEDLESQIEDLNDRLMEVKNARD